MVTKKRFVLLGAVGLVASFLLISLTAGVFAQGTITPTPTAVRPMMPMGTPGAHMRDAAAVTSTMPMSGTLQEMHRTDAVTSTMPMTSTAGMCDMMQGMMSSMMGMMAMGAMTSTMPMTATSSMCDMMKAA